MIVYPRCKKCNRNCPIGKLLCGKCLKLDRFKVKQSRDSTRGKNARGVCLHKPDKPRTKMTKFRTGTPPPGFKDPFKTKTGRL